MTQRVRAVQWIARITAASCLASCSGETLVAADSGEAPSSTDGSLDADDGRIVVDAAVIADLAMNVDTPNESAITDTVSDVHAADATVSSDIPRCSTPMTMCGDGCIDPSSDVHHCGGCSMDCARLPGVDPASARCVAGACDLVMACVPGRRHCSSDPAVGCETDVTTPLHCGSCAATCMEPAPFCSMEADGTYACMSGCSGVTPTRCNAMCVNTQTDPNNCGACDRACTPVASSVTTCTSGVCGFRCNAGYHACGARCAANADPASCGSACAPCPIPLHGVATCDGTSCGVACDAGYHVCSGSCVSDMSIATCGRACTPCRVDANGVAGCDGSRCTLTCNAGYLLVAGACAPIAAPRPMSPLSTAIVTSRRPTLRWQLAPGLDGAVADICRDRACSIVLTTLNATGSQVAPGSDLPTGTLFWRLRGVVGGARGTNLSPTWQFTVGARSAGVDTSSGSMADINGDGYSDIVIGAPQLSSREGVAAVFLGSPRGVFDYAAYVLRGPDGVGRHYFGSSVASAGDVNGDGFSDVIVGASHIDAYNVAGGPGRAFVFLGAPTRFPSSLPIALSGPDGQGSCFGCRVAGVGDVNGDGYADVAVGAPYANNNAGAVYVFLGSAAGTLTTSATRLAVRPGPNAYFGSVASAGDVNGDGFGDVLVGAADVDGLGRTYVFAGGSTGLSVTPTITLQGPDGVGSGFGGGRAGDFNGDGYSDVAISAANANGGIGRVYVFSGGASGLASLPSAVLTGPDGAMGSFGSMLAVPGDVDGDGFADLAVGADRVSGNAGRVYLYRGGVAGLATTATATIASPGSGGERFGRAIGSSVDVNGDGAADIAVGAPYASSAIGRVYVFLGSTTGIRFPMSATLTSPVGEEDTFFGWSVLR